MRGEDRFPPLPPHFKTLVDRSLLFLLGCCSWLKACKRKVYCVPWVASPSLCVVTGYVCHMISSRQQATCWRCRTGNHPVTTQCCYRNRDSHPQLLHKGKGVCEIETDLECVCVWERESVCVCVWERTCVWVRERERERERERKHVCERERVCMCERQSTYVCVRERKCVCY